MHSENRTTFRKGPVRKRKKYSDSQMQNFFKNTINIRYEANLFTFMLINMLLQTHTTAAKKIFGC